jgi:hypothetical protein
VDWNNDGKKDLLTGEYDGSIRIYLNTGTDADPAFSGFTYLQAAGSKFDAGDYSMVHVVDWDNDSKKDVLCGESEGKVWLLINTGTDASPVFDDKVFLKKGAVDLDVGYRSAPSVADWNRDGKKDLLSGDSNGYVNYFENTGTDANPAFSSSVRLMAGGSNIKFLSTSRPFTVDWDEDGVVDLLCGDYYGHVTYFHAMGPLALSENRIFASTGNTIDLAIDAGASNGGRNYLVLGTASGTEPGYLLPGGLATLPLNWDSLTDVFLSLVNTSIFPNFLGQLNNSGEAKAQIVSPVLPSTAVGAILHFAYCLNGPFDYASNATAIEIVP